MVAVLTFSFSVPSHAFTDQLVIRGFNKTVFGSEFTAFGFQSHYVRKFQSTVRFYIHTNSKKNRRRAVRSFVRSLNGKIKGLRSRIVSNPKSANFHLYIVDRKDYRNTIQQKVYRSIAAPIRGRCMVRSIFTRKGITRSDAIIVSDEGEKLFNRCLVEEVLQGLGPLNEDTSLKLSVFNDTSRHTKFTRFDRLILNMLYDRRLKSGDSATTVQALLPSILKDAKRRVR